MKILVSVVLLLSSLVSLGQKNTTDSVFIKGPSASEGVCPHCHKKEFVIPIRYGKPGTALIKLAEQGKVKLGGCVLSAKSPKFYCKADKLEF
jgi:hypothetical protein